MDKKERYLQWGYCEYKDTEIDMVKGDYVQVMNEQVDKIADLEAKLAESEKTIEELKGKRLEFYIDDVRQTQVINGVHFDIEQLLVFSEYVEHIKQQLAEKEKECEEYQKLINDTCNRFMVCSLNEITQNQTAIAKLEKLLDKTQTLDVMVQSGHYINQKKVNVVFKDVIDQQIKSLKGDSQ